MARRIKRGEAAAFRHFFDRYHGHLFRFLRRRGLDVEVCEDVIQQAFITVWERRSEIDESRSVRALLFKIGYNRGLNHVRDSARLVGSAPLSELVESSNPEGHAEYGMMLDRLHAVVRSLPEKRRAVFELCFLQELTYREAAETLGISAKTVEHQMSAALKQLRKAFESHERSRP